MKERSKRSILWKIDKEELINSFNELETLSSLLRRYGLRAAGGNHKTLERVLKSYNVDFEEKKKTARRSKTALLIKSNKISTKDIFTINSPFARSTARRRLIKENIIPYICKECGQRPEWNGQPLTLILDHINGVYNDHRIENLRFVCGNCNSQLDTHCGRNKKGA